MLDIRFAGSTERFVGQEFEAKIKEVDPWKKLASSFHVVKLLKQLPQQLVPKYSVNWLLAIVTGKVARITSFGAFIDLGALDGLVHFD